MFFMGFFLFVNSSGDVKMPKDTYIDDNESPDGI